MSGRFYVRPAEQVACGLEYLGGGGSSCKRIDAGDAFALFYANFSGFGVAAEEGRLVSEVEAFYLRGEGIVFADGSGVGAPGPEEAAVLVEKGMPVSGDETARLRHWRVSGEWPMVRDVWASIGLGVDGEPVAPVQMSIFDLLSQK